MLTNTCIISKQFNNLKKEKKEHTFKIGDHVKWNFETGYVSRKIIKIHNTDFDNNVNTHNANEEVTQYAIISDKTDHIAVHKYKALSKLNK